MEREGAEETMKESVGVCVLSELVWMSMCVRSVHALILPWTET